MSTHQLLLCVSGVLLLAAKFQTSLAGLYNENVIDSYIFKNKEYILVSSELRPSTADLYCSEMFKGELLRVKTEELAIFLAEALSETNHYLDNIWTSGFKVNNTWKWTDDEVVDQDLLDKYYIGREDEQEYNTTRECLAFRRNTLSEPRFISLSCALPRPAICERNANRPGPGEEGSTHSDWIKIGDRSYKIYQDRVTYENASKNCIRHDNNARLAVIETTEDAEELGRFMVIGRPKISNAWIGASWSEARNSYQFDEELLLLANETNEQTRYPPWRDGTIQNKAGCVFMRRHREGVHFIEAQCSRFRPYICYKIDIDESDSHAVDNNTIVFYRPRSFSKAKKHCESLRPTPGILAEPRTEEDMKRLLFIMGESNIPIDHIWLGGWYHVPGGWKWLSDQETIPTNESYPVWLKNNTYSAEVEDGNRCLNLDREDHNVGTFYGTDCHYRQRFICILGSAEVPTTTKPTTTTTATTTTTTTTTTTERVTTSTTTKNPETQSSTVQTTPSSTTEPPETQSSTEHTTPSTTTERVPTTSTEPEMTTVTVNIPAEPFTIYT